MGTETPLVQRLLPQYHAADAGAPAYQRIKDALVREIQQGALAPGDQVPSENELVQSLGLSRMTVNRALRELTSEGVLVRARGVGTFVAENDPTAIPLVGVENIAEGVHRRGHAHEARTVLLRQERVEPGDWLERAGFAAGPVFRSRLLHRENGLPLQLEDRWVAPEQAPQYLEQDFARSTPSTYLSSVAPVVRGRHVVTATLADPEQRALLEVAAGEPCLRLERRTWSATGLVSLAHLLSPGSRARLEGEFGGLPTG